MAFGNLKSGWRNITKNKLFSIINILGLSIGLAVTTLILFWVVDELNYDRFHANIDKIYTIFEHQEYSDGQELFTPCTPFPLSSKLMNEFDEVEHATTFANMGTMPLSYGDKEFIDGPVYFTDNEFLNIYSFKIIEGDKDILENPDKIIVTQEIANLFFKGESAIGKTIKLNGDYNFEIGAVIERPGKNSTIDFKILAPIEFMAKQGWIDRTAWGNNWPRTSVLLRENVDDEVFGNKISSICKDNGQNNTSLYPFAFKKERLYSYSGKQNRVQYIYQFLAIAFIIILIASINFVNFSTARSEQRRPEVGIRKTMGASKLSLTQLFVCEKGLMVSISILFSFILVAIFMPTFSRLADKTISLELFQNKYLLILLASVIVFTLICSVAYPALYMSSFTPARVMKKQNKHKSGFFGFKSMLVVTQFALSIGLIICSIFISNQLKYMSNYDLGYNKDNLIHIDLPGATKESHGALSEEFNKISGIVSMSKVNTLPFFGASSSWGYDWDGKDPERMVLISNMRADRNYFATLGLEFTEGRSFSEIFDTWETNENIKRDEVILNEEAIRRMGMDDPIGKYFRDGQRASIVGVVENFNFQSLRMGIEPLLITPLTGHPDNIIIRIQPQGFYKTVNQIKKAWANIHPQTPISIGFFDERLKELYNSELKIAGLFKSFTFIAIFISCIGLFGLSLYAIELRRKEIGVRKVNGSTRLEIISLINKDFVSRVIIAFIFASPVAYYAMNKWLENFAYKTELNWWVFVLAGLTALLIAIFTISWQSWKAATRNPVEALRYE